MRPRRPRRHWLWLIPIAGLGMIVLALALFALGLASIYTRGILPGVSVGDIALGGLTRTEAAQTLRTEWRVLTLRDGERRWNVAPADLGLTLDVLGSVDASVNAVRDALATGDLDGIGLRVRHQARQHVVQSGESLTSIAWDYGIPYPYIQQANGGVSALYAGQTLTIPPADQFLLVEPVPHKRVEVSLSQQRTRVYENGQLLWDWPSSTGIADSPTWPGVYQIISHEPNAYASNWNLYMPHFLGVYQPVPGSAFTNGFHGFPTRGGGQLLWENSLGRRVTYGCILLSSRNAEQLYNWAEEGVVVVITN